MLNALSKTVIWPIQYLRGIAALMVVWHHSRGQVPEIARLFPNAFGASGVDLFFVISGFIMAVTALQSMQGPWHFWRRRLIRVVPLYWALTLLMVGAWLIKPALFKTLSPSWSTLAQSLLFIPHFSASFPDKVWPLLVPGWSLNYEMFFYGIFGLTLALPQRLRVPAMSLFLLAMVSAGYLLEPLVSAAQSVYFSPLLLEFLLGVWIGSLWLQGQIVLPLGVSVVLIFGGAMLLVSGDALQWGGGGAGFGATCVVLGALNARISQWRSALFRALGDSSYSLYLTHIFTLGVLRVVWGQLSPEITSVSAWIFLILSLGVSAAVGWVVYKYVEMPLTRRWH